MNPVKYLKALVPIALAGLYSLQQLIADGELTGGDGKIIVAAVLAAIVTYLVPNSTPEDPAR